MSWINDPVNSPKHYTDSHPGMECIDLTADTTFCLGNCCKYLWRYHSKGRPLEDLEKARWYLCRVIDYGEKIAWTRQQYDILTALVAHTVGVEARTWAKLKQGYPDSALALIISIALAALVVPLVIACIALIWSLMLEQHLI